MIDRFDNTMRLILCQFENDKSESDWEMGNNKEF